MNIISGNEYDRKSEEQQWRGPEVVFGMICEYLRRGEKILDVGIGTGLSSRLYRDMGLSVWGMDNSDRQIRLCREKEIATELVKHDLNIVPWPYEENEFDHIISVGVLNHFKELQKTIKEINRIQRQGGMIGFTVEEDILRKKNGKWEKKEKMDKSGHYIHSPDYVVSVLHENKYGVLKELIFRAYVDPETEKEYFFRTYIAKNERE